LLLSFQQPKQTASLNGAAAVWGLLSLQIVGAEQQCTYTSCLQHMHRRHFMLSLHGQSLPYWWHCGLYLELFCDRAQLLHHVHVHWGWTWFVE
jgi:hypothetical protein